MTNSEINNYVAERYYRWLDYAQFYCKRANIPGDAGDILNEVLVSLLQKDIDKLLGLLRRRKEGYTELDWYVLRMIKLNVKSPTSPYQQKMYNKRIDCNVDVFRLQLEDVCTETEDRAGRLLQEMNMVRDILDHLSISDNCKAIFSFHFFQGESFANWHGNESTRRLYDVYNQVRDMIRKKIREEIAF